MDTIVGLCQSSARPMYFTQLCSHLGFLAVTPGSLSTHLNLVCASYGRKFVLRAPCGLLQARGMVLAGMRSTPAVAVKPWIAYQNFSWKLGRGPWGGRTDARGLRVGYPELSYYQEMVLHSAATGIGASPSLPPSWSCYFQCLQ